MLSAHRTTPTIHAGDLLRSQLKLGCICMQSNTCIAVIFMMHSTVIPGWHSTRSDTQLSKCGPCRYELCNQYGLYIMDEANVETHGFGGPPVVLSLHS